MPRAKESADSDVSEEPYELEKLLQSEEHVEHVEYEEVEEEEVDEVEEEVDQGLEEEGNSKAANETTAQKEKNGKRHAKVVEDEKEKHDELLALPPHGSEVYLGGIPHDLSEEDLKSLCEPIGEVTEVKVMKGRDSFESRGFAFVTFRTKELAYEAIEKLNNIELKGKRIRCSSSLAKNKLFIGNVPRQWLEQDMRRAVTEAGPGVICVELVKDSQNTGRNRGYAFVEYYNTKCAEYSRKKMLNPTFKLGDNTPTVSWADRKNADLAASQVKAVYVKNLPEDVTQDHLRVLFEHHGTIKKVVIPPAKAGQENGRFGFVHFVERSSAIQALKDTEKYEIDGSVLECSIAKPQAERLYGGYNSHKSSMHQKFPTNSGYGLYGAGYSSVGAGYGAAPFGQQGYGRGNSPAGMTMVPIVLPDGRIGYVLQYPGTQSQLHSTQPHDGRGGASGGSTSERKSDSSRGSSRYSPY